MKRARLFAIAAAVAIGIAELAQPAKAQDKVGLRWLASALKIDPKHRPTHQVLADHFQQRGNAQAAAFHRKLAEGSP